MFFFYHGSILCGDKKINVGQTSPQASTQLCYLIAMLFETKMIFGVSSIACEMGHKIPLRLFGMHKIGPNGTPSLWIFGKLFKRGVYMFIVKVYFIAFTITNSCISSMWSCLCICFL